MTIPMMKPRLTGFDACRAAGRHSPVWVNDYEGDPGVVNGINDLSEWICSECEERFGGYKSREPDAELEGGDCNEDDSEGDDE